MTLIGLKRNGASPFITIFSMVLTESLRIAYDFTVKLMSTVMGKKIHYHSYHEIAIVIFDEKFVSMSLDV